MVLHSIIFALLEPIIDHPFQLIVWLFIFVIIASTILDIIFLGHGYVVNWIRGQLESLEAPIKDYDQLVMKGRELESKATRFWDLEDLSGIHLKLSEDEHEWVRLTKDVVKKANDCVTNYEKHGGFIRGCLTAIFRSIPIRDAIREIYKVKSEITVKKEEFPKDIYKSMEKSRSQIGSLLGLYAIGEADESIADQSPKETKHSTSLDELLEKSRDLFSSMEDRWSIYLLIALNAFVKDLRQLHLETETEQLWKKEAEDIIVDAESYIGNLSWWVSRFKLKKIILKVMAPRIVRKLDDLLERKEKFNFVFIDRAAQKSTTPHVSDDNTKIKSALEDIQSKLSKRDKNQKPVAKMKSMLHGLKEMHKMLQEAEETAGRNACLEQLKSIAQEVNSSLDQYMNKPKLSLHVTNAVDLLRKLIKFCRIKRQESAKVVGFKNEVRDLVSKLTSNSDNPSTLSIVGMMGVGKTTLAKAIYYNKDVVEHFPIRVWVKVTERAYYNSQVRLMKKDGTIEKNLKVTKIGDHLKRKLCLVVLDNVLKTEDFDTLSDILSKCGMANGSRIMLTTRFKNVISHSDRCSTPHQVRLLTKEESWALFQQATNIGSKDLEQNEEMLARKAVGRCGGLPIAILSLGCVMSAKGMTPTNLLWVLDRINHGHYRAQWKQVWEENEKETMTRFLYYLTLFPLDFEIPARRLVNTWVAEGLVTTEDNAERCLEDLRDHNMIQVVELKSNGKIKTCRLPSMLRDVLIKSNRTSRSQYLSTHLESGFSYHFDDRGLDANSANVFSKKEIPRSLFFFDKREGSQPGERIGKILKTGIESEQFTEIRVLDLEHIFRPRLPETLVKLVYLKYLGLRWTYLEELPPFIGKLVNLETLDIKHTCIRVLPSSIWKLKKLRNLYLNHKYRSRLEGKLRGKLQENLQTLWGVFMYENCPLLCHLDRLKNLKKLKISFQLTETGKERLAKMIVKLNQLHSLRLRSVDGIGNPKKLILNNMSMLENLSSLQLFGKLEDKLRMSWLPRNLTDLTLSNSKLSEDPMPELQKLSELKSLCLYADSYMGRTMVCTTGGFQKLQVLRFWNLRDLTDWDVEEGSMPNLSEFEARSCRNLAFPAGLKHLKSLRTIKLHDMHLFNQELSDHKNMLPDGIETSHD